ncbi:unnamed protein product [Protopolystoma xenopodis]|uniref:Uncharacterized protein n=1 Tax=Protopolystoma xenopodis TaxID=117903 RepID=A0A448X6L2_9PLAT|nr:unnamed protein product [Protopolystoma xenopodis]
MSLMVAMELAYNLEVHRNDSIGSVGMTTMFTLDKSCPTVVSPPIVFLPIHASTTSTTDTQSIESLTSRSEQPTIPNFLQSCSHKNRLLPCDEACARRKRRELALQEESTDSQTHSNVPFSDSKLGSAPLAPKLTLASCDNFNLPIREDKLGVDSFTDDSIPSETISKAQSVGRWVREEALTGSKECLTNPFPPPEYSASLKAFARANYAFSSEVEQKLEAVVRKVPYIPYFIFSGFVWTEKAFFLFSPNLIRAYYPLFCGSVQFL